MGASGYFTVASTRAVLDGLFYLFMIWGNVPTEESILYLEKLFGVIPRAGEFCQSLDKAEAERSIIKAEGSIGVRRKCSWCELHVTKKSGLLKGAWGLLQGDELARRMNLWKVGWI